MKCLTWLRSNTFGARYSACCKWRADQQSAQQNWENGEAGAGDSQPAWQHRLHSAEASSMAADAFGRHCHPRVCPHRPGLHWHRRRPFCHVTEHHSDGGEARGHRTHKPAGCHAESWGQVSTAKDRKRDMIVLNGDFVKAMCVSVLRWSKISSAAVCLSIYHL